MQSDKKQLQKELDIFLGKGKTWRKRIVFTAIIVGLFLLFDIYGPGGQVRFYAKWIECGQKPVVVNPGIEFGGGSVRDYAPASAFSLMRPFAQYYCTPLEAEKAGVSANPDIYEFPHIDAERAKGNLQ